MQALRRLSLVNVRISAAPAFEACTVDIDAIASYMGRPASKLSSLFGLLFRRSTCQHPLLAAALGALSVWDCQAGHCWSGVCIDCSDQRHCYYIAVRAQFAVLSPSDVQARLRRTQSAARP